VLPQPLVPHAAAGRIREPRVSTLRFGLRFCAAAAANAAREIFERLTGCSFPHASGLFEANRRWQLDEYNKELGVAETASLTIGSPRFRKTVRQRCLHRSRGAVAGNPNTPVVIPHWLSAAEREALIMKELWHLGVSDVRPG
jgi:hypothetical protein